MSPTKFDTAKALRAGTAFAAELREMYAFEQANGSPGTFYHYCDLIPVDAETLELAYLLERRADDGRVRLTWQGRKFVRDHL